MSEREPGNFLSACLMVKDEEKNLERCLRSIQGVVDEIVVVDTGSKDRTIEIARSFGAVIYERPWENDFSKHRNQTIDYATGEWVFIIDADEELFFAKGWSKESLKKYLGEIPKEYTAAGLLLKDIQKGVVSMEFNTTRIFRKGTVHYEGIVHNTPQIAGKEAVLCEFAYLQHYGYDLTPEQKRTKYQRTNTLLRARLAENPFDHAAYFYLCQLNAEGGTDNKEAMYWGLKYFDAREEIKKTGDNFNKSIYFTLFRLLLNDKQGEKAREVLQAGIQDLERDLDLTLATIEYGNFVGDTNIVLEGAKAFIEMYQEMDKDPTMKANRFVYSHCYPGLAFALYHLSLNSFVEGAKAFSDLQNVLNRVPAPMKEGYLRDFQASINNAGLPFQISVERRAPANQAPELLNNVVATEIQEEALA